MIVPLLFGTAATARSEPHPTITHVLFDRAGQTYDATIVGRNFGVSPVALPCDACAIPELRLRDMVALATDEPLTITAWTDTIISVSGVTGKQGDAIWVAVTNDASGGVGVLSRSLGGSKHHPIITSITFSGSGATRRMTVAGIGFGPAPAGVPGVNDLPYFIFSDWNDLNNPPWNAGFGFVNDGHDAVQVSFSSWTDTQIVINGFGSYYGYGSNGWTAKTGDPFAITVFSSSGPSDQSGPQVGKSGRLP